MKHEEATIRTALGSIAHRSWKGSSVLSDSPLDRNRSARNMPYALGICKKGLTDEQSNFAFHGEIYSPNESHILNQISDSIQSGDLDALSNILSEIDGDYAFVSLTKDGLVFGRDPLGAKPLFVCSSKGAIGVASEPQALTLLKPNSIQLVRPGAIQKAGTKNVTIQTKYLTRSKLNRYHQGYVVENVLKLLRKSIEARIGIKKKVAIGFSGGLDSSLIAYLAEEYTKVKLVSTYAKGSGDEEDVQTAAEKMGLDISVETCTEDSVKRYLALPYVNLSASEMDLAIGYGVHTDAWQAARLGCETLMLGQLADECFGGYAKYERAFKKEPLAAHRMMFHDVVSAHSSGFIRDEKAASPFIDLSLPYANLGLVEFVLSIHPMLNLGDSSELRKIVLRKAALKAGLPKELAMKPKKAFQYSSGIGKLVMGRF